MSSPFKAPAGPRFGAALLAALLVLSGAGSALAQDGGSAPGDPGTGIPPSPVPGGPITFNDDATPAVPMPGGIVDPRPIAWDHVTIWPDGRSLTVYFWNGVDACYGLDRVELAEVDGILRITPYVGFRVDAANKRCIELAQLYAFDLTLGAPIVGGGVEGVEGPQPVPGAMAEVILPGAAVVQSNQQPWERIQVAPDGRSLWVWFTGGVRPCYDLERVAFEPVDGLPTLTLHTGPTDTLAMCIAIAVQYMTPAAIPDPLVLGVAA